jgi:DNA-binding NarL/FixJ family response regulator
MHKYECIHLMSGRASSSAKNCKSSTEPTPRELEVEELLCRGYSHENIAAIFGRSLSTVSVHVTSLYKKRGVHSQVGLLLAYLERKQIFVFNDQSTQNASRRGTLLEVVR